MRRDVRGSFCGIPALGGDCISVRRGQMVNVDEIHGLRMLLTGEAQEGGDKLAPAWQAPPPKEIARLRAQIAELTPPDPIDLVYAQLTERRKTGRAPTQAETDTLRRALTL